MSLHEIDNQRSQRNLRADKNHLIRSAFIWYISVRRSAFNSARSSFVALFLLRSSKAREAAFKIQRVGIRNYHIMANLLVKLVKLPAPY